MSAGWIIGWAIGGVVVLLVIIGLGRRITRQARDITDALDGARSNTDALFDVTRTDLAIERITRGLHSVRTGGRQ